MLADPGSGWRWDKGVCRFCGVGCGIKIATAEGRVVAVQGDPENDVNRGLLCAKGYANAQIQYGDDNVLKRLRIEKGDVTRALAEAPVVARFSELGADVDLALFHDAHQVERLQLIFTLAAFGVHPEPIEDFAAFCGSDKRLGLAVLPMVGVIIIVNQFATDEPAVADDRRTWQTTGAAVDDPSWGTWRT